MKSNKRNPYFDMDILDVPYSPIVNQFSSKSSYNYLKDLDNWEFYIETIFNDCLVKGMSINEANPSLHLSSTLNSILIDDSKPNDELFDTNTFFLEFCLYGDDKISGDFYNYVFKRVFNNSEEVSRFLLSIAKFMNTPYISTFKKGMLPTITAMAKMNPDVYDVYKFFNSYNGINSIDILTNKNCEMEFVYYDIMKSYLQEHYKITKISTLFKDKIMVIEDEKKDSTTNFYVASFNMVVVMEWKLYSDKDTGVISYYGNGSILWLDYASIAQPFISPLIYRIPISNRVISINI